MPGWIPSIEPAAFLLLALGLLLLPIRWVAAFLLAAAVHELCHWAAVRLCGGKIRRFSIGIFGADLQAEGLSRGQLLICTLAGPLGGLLLLLLARWMPALAVCALVQSACNLIPLGSLDGARALRYICQILFSPRTAEGICRIVEGLCFFAVCGVSLWLKLGILPLAAVLLVRYGRKKEKFLANCASREYNRGSMTCEVSL